MKKHADLEWVEVNETWDDFRFTKRRGPHPLCRGGVMLELKEQELIIIGDVNALGGVCDDCTSPRLRDETVVLRAAVLYNKE